MADAISATKCERLKSYKGINSCVLLYLPLFPVARMAFSALNCGKPMAISCWTSSAFASSVSSGCNSSSDCKNVQNNGAEFHLSEESAV